MSDLLSADTFQANWKASAERFDELLGAHLESGLANTPTRLAEAIRYSLLAPGKRFRPLLAMWAAEAICGDSSIAIPAAIAVEMIHCYSLIHDDLPAMDDDDLRRGRPTCHVQFDEATAILAGDALQPMAFEVLATQIESPKLAAKACWMLAKAAGPSALVGGQADDLRAETEGGDETLLAAIHSRKTGAMIQVSVELGGLLASGTDLQLRQLAMYGKSIGQAFQIVDDLLDVQGNPETLGKRTGKDIQRGKLTYPGFYGVDASLEAARDYTERAVEAVEIFGVNGTPLVQLAKYILERKH
jgi:geranylgeranyl diphosphate synthase, type II